MISEFPVFFCSTCIVFFWRLIPIRLGFVSLPVLHNVGGRSGDVKGPGNATVLLKKGPNMIVTWSGGVPWSLRDWPLGCWSSWTVLKVVIDLRKHYCIFHVPGFPKWLLCVMQNNSLRLCVPIVLDWGYIVKYHGVFQDLVCHSADLAQAARWRWNHFQIKNHLNLFQR